MTTYSALRDRALNKVGCLGQSEAQTLAQLALEECMRFVAFHVRIPSLISSATATAPANPTLKANAITLGGAGFNITSTYQCVDRLYVAKDNTSDDEGVPYEYREYNQFLDLKNSPGAYRYGVMDLATSDENPEFVFTITPGNKLWAMPLKEGNYLTLYYRITPAAYSGAATPEILPLFDHILCNGAELALKEWLREPDRVINMWQLFEANLMSDIQRYNEFNAGQRRRTHLKIHKSYRVY